MAANDWESLMNGVFGSQGRFRAGQSQAQPQQSPDAATIADSQQALEQELRRQAQEIAQLGSQLTQSMEQDGLLLPGQAAAKPIPPPVHSAASLEAFQGLEQAVEQQVLGQPELVRQLVIAFKRPFVLGTPATEMRGSLLVHGPLGTGKPLALQTITAQLARRGLLPSDELARLELNRYPGPVQEKLFLQDLYAALQSPAAVLLLEGWQGCHPAFLHTLGQLVQTGKAPLNNRYLVQKGVLVETGTALAPGVVSHLSAPGKYLVFLGAHGPQSLAAGLGAQAVSALGDVCQSKPFEAQTLTAIAAQQLNQLARYAQQQLGWTVEMDAALRDLAAAQATPGRGALPIGEFCTRCRRALAEYRLQQEQPIQQPLVLTAQQGRVVLKQGDIQPVDLLGLLRQPYTGDLQQAQQQLEALVGLEPVKEYVRSLYQNVQVQQRRAAQGLKAQGVSMHMIFTGNPGTGKTTIARLVGQYLKAMGALSSGQLVEVSRADLVGRYVGHTAPLTQQVIQSALGGVLFIDEAYSLCRGQQDTFGLEAIDTLVKGMEDHREDLVVILAGYTKEMQDFLQANSGLRSRFPNQIEFPDYTGPQLWQITCQLATARGYQLSADCQQPLTAYYTAAQQTNAREQGNGRLARNTLEQAILNQSRRLMVQTQAPLELLLPQDFELEQPQGVQV